MHAEQWKCTTMVLYQLWSVQVGIIINMPLILCTYIPHKCILYIIYTNFAQCHTCRHTCTLCTMHLPPCLASEVISISKKVPGLMIKENCRRGWCCCCWTNVYTCTQSYAIHTAVTHTPHQVTHYNKTQRLPPSMLMQQLAMQCNKYVKMFNPPYPKVTRLQYTII